jgi:ribulose-5-phosphate 4-epimerase/fuculose-1-phosphate aldolase
MSNAPAMDQDQPTATPAAAAQPFEEAEWAARLQLAAAYRIFNHLGWSELIYNHISLRVPGPERHFLINPFGLHYSEVKASNLVKVDLEGRIVAPSPWGINPAGFTPHATIHRHLDHAHCVMHMHTTAGMAVACSQEGLSMTNFYAAQLADGVAYHDFEGITVQPDEGPRLLASIGRRQAVILRNHGLLAWGETLPKTLYTLWVLQRACEIQVAGAALGARIPIPEPIQHRCAEVARGFNQQAAVGEDVFAAMTRVIDRSDPSWRE